MKVKISKIKSNPNNPRLIKDYKFLQLVDSIKQFPEMLEKRPVVCFTDTDGKYVVLGGNMRLKASKEAGLKELPIILADEWTEEQKNEFIIKDNIGFGEWDWDLLANKWNDENLKNWGVEVPIEFDNDIDLTDFFNEPDKEQPDPANKIILEYNEEDYNKVIEAFDKHSGSKEDIIIKLLCENL